MRCTQPITGVFVVAAMVEAANAATYGEAPMLRQLVDEGKLRPVDDRLPDRPLVVKPVRSIGRYGGAWRRIAITRHDIGMAGRLGYEPLVRWDRAGRKVVPGLAESWEVRDGGRTYVFRLRKGTRWSDGHPFTSEDLHFYYHDVLLNEELTPVFPAWLTSGNVRGIIATPDPYTIEFRFAEPYGIFLEMLAYRSAWLLTPKHYLEQFHPAYAHEERLLEEADEQGLDHWFQLFWQKYDSDGNPDLPTLRPWTVKVPLPATRVIVERNPYYWKTDPAGNQLPYIDRIVYTIVQRPSIANFKAMAGEVDFQARFMDPANFPLFMTNREKGRYRVQRDVSPCAFVIYVNPHSKDEALRSILADRRFRIAMSVAINREELIDLIYTGMAEPARGVASPYDPYYLPEFDRRHLDYDPGLANKLLDEVGLKRGRSGMRKMPDGKPFRQIINCFPSEEGATSNLWQLVADNLREVGLDFVVKVDARTLSSLQIRTGNTNFWAYHTAGVHWIVNPTWYVPWTSGSYFAPLYGRYQASGRREGIGLRPPPEYQRLIDWYRELRSVVGDDRRQLELGRRILRQWSEQCYTIGIARPEVLTIVSNRFKNVPDAIIHSYRLMTPGYIGVEQFYIDED